MAALRNRAIASRMVVKLECSLDFNTLARVRFGVIEMHAWLIHIPSKNNDLVRIQRYTQMCKSFW